MIATENKAWLLLEDGHLFEGKSLGATGSSLGEVIFSTSMVGYQEALSDPVNYGQILVQTFPLIGNYGVNSEDMSSPKCHLHGYIIREWCDTPSNFRCEGNINDFLKEQGVIGLYDIDTRKLTRLLREKGTMNGLITTTPIADKEAALKGIKAYAVKNAVQAVTDGSPADETVTSTSESAPLRVGVLNLGCSGYLTEELRRRGCEVHLMNPSQPVSQLLAAPVDGWLLSEGPGDPTENPALVEAVTQLSRSGLPLMGIGLGHQLLALANGMSCCKLLHGHRGASQPVIDLNTGKTYITAQNHGYIVDAHSIDEAQASICYKNANDQSCEGLRYHHIPAFSVQFRPQGVGSRQDTAFLYDQFLEMIRQSAAR